MSDLSTRSPHRLRRAVIGLTAASGVAASVVIATGFTPAAADYTRCAKTDRVAVRTLPDGTARDNLSQGDKFVIQRGDSSSHYVYGYKQSNDVHGYVLNSSLEVC